MKERLSKLNKETRCFIMSAILFFKGFNQVDQMAEIDLKMDLNTLGLSKEDIVNFPMPDYSQIVSNLKNISDPEVRHFILSNTYLPVLRSQKTDAFKAFKIFCSDLRWSSKEIRESMELTEQISDLKPINNYTNNSRPGCLSVVVLVIISTTLLAFTLL